MNYANIFKSEKETLEKERQEKLKEYDLDDESIKKFRSKIKKASEDESNTLGKILYEYMLEDRLTYNEILNLVLLGTNVNYTAKDLLFYGATSLFFAITKNKDDIAQLLIKAGADINYVVPSKESSVMSCICNKNIKLLKLLILLGADLTLTNAEGKTALDIAKEKNDAQCIQILETAMNKNNVKIPEDNSIVKLDILTMEQINSLEIFKKYGIKAAITDFSVVLGGYVSNYDYALEDINLNSRTGCWWIKTFYDERDVRMVDSRGSKILNYIYRRDIGYRPALPYSSISSISSNKERCINDVLEVEFGEYPQWACSKEICEILEDLYLNNNLNKTGKCYTTDSRHYNENNKDFKPQEYIEYEYNGKKYVRIKVNSYCDGEEFTLSNTQDYKNGDFVWIEVSPIKWLVDEKKDIAITKNIIVAGIQFNKENNYTGDNFDKMNIKKFMDNYLSKEIISDVINYKTNNEIKEERKEETLESIIEEAKKEMPEVLENIPFQKIKK